MVAGRDARNRLRTRPFDDGLDRYCFHVDQVDHLPTADLFLIERDDRTLEVGNIVPRDQAQLSIAQYNALIEEFCERMVRPGAEEMGVVVELTSNHFDLEQWLSRTANRKLMAFSAGADHRSTAWRQDRRRRWLDFVVTAHREGSKLPARMLRRWLIEVADWDAEEADQLASEFEFGKEILNYSHDEPARV